MKKESRAKVDLVNRKIRIGDIEQRNFSKPTANLRSITKREEEIRREKKNNNGEVHLEENGLDIIHKTHSRLPNDDIRNGVYHGLLWCRFGFMVYYYCYYRLVVVVVSCCLSKSFQFRTYSICVSSDQTSESDGMKCSERFFSPT